MSLLSLHWREKNVYEMLDGDKVNSRGGEMRNDSVK